MDIDSNIFSVTEIEIRAEIAWHLEISIIAKTVSLYFNLFEEHLFGIRVIYIYIYIRARLFWKLTQPLFVGELKNINHAQRKEKVFLFYPCPIHRVILFTVNLNWRN